MRFQGCPSVRQELSLAIQEKHLLVIVGTGISADASGNDPLASWQGLLHDGVRRCVELQPELASAWQHSVLQDITSRRYLKAADRIVNALGGQDHGDFQMWIEDTVGSFEPVETQAIRNLNDIGIPIATTNYDTLIEQVTGKHSLTWQADQEDLIDWIRDDRRRKVLHVHGCWLKPDSIILTNSSYKRVRRAAHLQQAIRSIAIPYSFLLVGFGDGVNDPHFRSLRNWIAQRYHGVGHHHFRLVPDAEFDAARKIHKELDDRFVVLPYSGSLADAINDLSVRSPGLIFSNRIDVRRACPEDISRIYELDSQTFSGDDLIKPDVLASWQTKNPDSFWCIRQGANNIEGYYSILFLKKEALGQFVGGQRVENSFTAEDICTLDDAMSRDEVYLFSVVVGKSPAQRSQVLNDIVRRLEWYYQHGNLKTVYVTAATDDGERTLQSLQSEGQAYLFQKEDRRADHHPLYRIDLTDQWFQNWHDDLACRLRG